MVTWWSCAFRSHTVRSFASNQQVYLIAEGAEFSLFSLCVLGGEIKRTREHLQVDLHGRETERKTRNELMRCT
jgi:hypothetical protein